MKVAKFNGNYSWRLYQLLLHCLLIWLLFTTLLLTAQSKPSWAHLLQGKRQNHTLINSTLQYEQLLGPYRLKNYCSQ